jgi:hypothetical protein
MTPSRRGSTGRPRYRRRLVAVGLTVLCAALFTQLATGGVKASAVLVVPSAYPTIQAAVDAANPGDRIKVFPGTYVEQVSLGKNLTVTGSGIGSTIIRAPATLVAGHSGNNSIVEIHSGADVAISRLTVAGPGSGTCEAGALNSGIRVLEAGRLDLSFARVAHIHDTPAADCFRSGHGVAIGRGGATPSTGSANIRYSLIDDYQLVGILVLGEGSTATISRNIVRGPGRSEVVATDGIEFTQGAVGTVSHNVVSGNACGSPDLGCGPDFFTELQHAGIYAEGPGTVISQNLLYDNQVGIYVFDAAEISRNVLVNNHYFGAALQDGSFTMRGDRIRGGVGGVAVIAAFADTAATLDDVKIAATSGAPVQEFECCGFTATIGGP